MAFFDVLLGATAVFLATFFGSALIYAFKKIGRTGYAVLLSFSAGVMAFSAMEMIGQSHPYVSDAVIAVGVLSGLLALYASDRILPHVHARIRGHEISASKKKAAMIAGAITMHNVPEGLAIASAFAGSVPLGWLVTLSMAIQDIPEGFMISAPLACYGVEKRRCLNFGLLSAAVEAGAAIIGYIFLSIFTPLVPFGLAFAAGAMLYVIFAELLPDAFGERQERIAALSFAAGAAVAFGIASALAF